MHDGGGRHSDKKSSKSAVNLSDRRRPTLSLLPNKTANIKQNSSQFPLVVKATALKQQTFCPQILNVYDRSVTDNNVIASVWHS